MSSLCCRRARLNRLSFHSPRETSPKALETQPTNPPSPILDHASDRDEYSIAEQDVKGVGFACKLWHSLQAATTATALPAGAIRGHGGHVLDTADLDAGAGKRTERSLGTRARGLGLHSAGGADLDVDGSYAELLAADGDVLGGKHRSVRRGLVTIGLHLHAAGHADKGLAAGHVSDVDEGVVEGREDVRHSEELPTKKQRSILRSTGCLHRFTPPHTSLPALELLISSC
eukprot:2434193-Rhodomonas_salina.1